MPSGVLLFSGATDWEEVGRKNTALTRSRNTIWKPVRLAALKDKRVVSVSSGPGSVHMFVVTDEGEVFGWGRNEKGQLGLGDTKDRKCPALVAELTGHKVVKVATGKNHSLFLTDEGRVLACGDNKNGQSAGGSGVSVNTKPMAVVYDGPPAVKVACGGDFSVILDSAGGVWTWGLPEYGQLGHNTDGQYLEKAGKVQYRSEYNPVKIVMYVEKDPKTKQVRSRSLVLELPIRQPFHR